MSHLDVHADELSVRFLGVHDSQSVFRTLLDSFSQPGTVFHLPATLVRQIPPVEIPLLALLGYNTPFSMVDSNTNREQLIARATSGQVVSPSEAAYIAVCNPQNPLLPLGFPIGTAMRPDFAAQVAVQISGVFSAGSPQTSIFNISGPGVESINHVVCSGSQPGEFDFLTRRQWSVPCGVDMWLVGVDGSVIGVPRTSSIEIGSAWNEGVA